MTAGAALSSAYCFSASRFVGRRSETREVKSLLSDSRLLTLTGPGGVGKSRLAHHVAAGLRRAYPGEAVAVDLAEAYDPALLTQELQDPDLIAHLIATLLGVERPGAGTATEALIASLALRPTLLLLDNCDCLLPACAILAETLLRNCPGLRILATGREPLRIAGEVIYSVRPLPVPDPAGRAGVEELSLNESVALFLARAQALSPLELTAQDAPVVAELCRRLDGLPLAIELAAARIRALTPTQILERMDRRFELLSRGPRTAPARQRTLRACVDWSFELCSKPEQLLWSRLSVFHDGFAFDAAEGICTDESLSAEDLLDHLAGLVDKSVVISQSADDGIRYRMVETLSEYGREKLIEAGEHDEIRRRHRDWYARLVRRAADDRVSPRQTDWLARLDRELPNLRAALTYGDAAVDIAGPLWHLWACRGSYREGRGWLDQALAGPAGPTTSHLEACYGTTVLAAAQGDLDTAGAGARQAHEVAEQLSDDAAQAIAACADGVLAMARGQLAEAARAWQHAVALLPGGPWRAEAVTGLGRTLAMLGDVDGAASCHDQIVAICPPGEFRYSGASLGSLGIALWTRGDLRTATARLREALRRLRGAGDVPGMVSCLEILARIAAGEQPAERAATLLGPVADERQSVDEAVAYALGERPAPPAPSPAAPSPLTRREQQVAELVAQGRSNRDIAEALVISRRTAESHVDHILSKLGLANRAQIAAWAAAHDGAAR